MVRRAVLPFLCLCGGAAAFMVPLPPTQAALSQRAFGSLTKVQSAVQEPPTSAVAPIAGMTEEEFDINDFFDEEPVDPTPEQLAQISREEMEAVIPGDGRTVQQWLEQDGPVFRDGGSVLEWVKEAQRLRLLPFIERAEHLKSLSFDDINLFRFRSREWGQMLMEKGLLEAPEGMAEEGVIEIPAGEFAEKLEANRAKYQSAAEMEEALLKQMDAKLLAARFEGTAMDGKVKVVMDGRMQPISVEVTEGALGGSTDGAVLSGALEAAVEMAFKASAEFYETTLADDYLAKAQSPTDVEGIFEAFGNKEFELVADVVDPSMLE